jgi:ankyrin repeat protein
MRRILMYAVLPVVMMAVFAYANEFSELYGAVRKGDIEVVRSMLDKGVSTKAKNVALSDAIDEQQPYIVSLLIENGADVNSGERTNGNTPLHNACRVCQPDIVRMLLEAGANVNAKYINSGATPLHSAVYNLCPPGIIKTLLDNGAEVNVQDREGYAPLHLAARAISDDNVILLLEYGADIDLVTNNSETALDIAIKNGRKSIAQLLKNAGAK